MLKAALASLSKLNEWLEKAIYLLAIFIVANMVLALFLSALIRYASGTGYDWFIELPPILTSWLVFPLLGPLLKSGPISSGYPEQSSSPRRSYRSSD